jgi:hypothetical protein
MFGIKEQITKDVKADALYLDFKFDESGQSGSVCSFVKSIYLGEINNDFNEEEEVAKYLQQNIPNNDFEIFNISFENIGEDPFLTKEILKRKIISKLRSNAAFVATEGRMGLPNSLLLNANTYLNGSYGSVLNDAVVKFAEESDMKIYYSKYIEENVIYLMRNSENDNPGFYIFKHTDKNNKRYFSITGLGFFPEKQCIKINIMQDNITSDSIFSDNEQETNGVNHENINSIDEIAKMSRTLPLSECGLFLIYNVGVYGMSPKYAEEYINKTVATHRDYNNEIGKHFKFYKEFWLPDATGNSIILDIKLI